VSLWAYERTLGRVGQGMHTCRIVSWIVTSGVYLFCTSHGNGAGAEETPWCFLAVSRRDTLKYRKAGEMSPVRDD
jgi:hypothetical protein